MDVVKDLDMDKLVVFALNDNVLLRDRDSERDPVLVVEGLAEAVKVKLTVGVGGGLTDMVREAVFEGDVVGLAVKVILAVGGGVIVKVGTVLDCDGVNVRLEL